MGDTVEDTVVNKEAMILSYLNAYDDIEKEIFGLTEGLLKWKASSRVWSITEVLAHLVDHSIVVSFRLREVLANSEVRLPAFSQDDWVAGQKANEEQVEQIIAAAHSLVSYNASLLRRLSEQDWEKSGINAKGEPVAISAIIPAFVDHVQIHLNQIRRIKTGAAEAGVV